MRTISLMLLLAAAGCSGAPADPAPEQPAATGACDASGLGPVPLRRLTAVQYQNTVVDLFGAGVTPSSGFPAVNVSTGFSNDVDLNVLDEAGVEAIFDAAETVASQVVPLLPELLACDGERAACFEAFVATIAKRAYRRPLVSDEIDVLQGLFDASEGSSYDALGAVLEAILQSPQFLYLSETGAAATLDERGRVLLSDHELAARLSYLLWDTMPDEELLAEADAGRLHTPAELAAQARRLLASDRARPVVARFHREWLELGLLDGAAKSAALFPEFTPALAAAMQDEARRYVEAAFFEDQATLAELLTGAFTFPELDPSERAGLLTQPAFLASHAHSDQSAPVLRGKVVRVGLLCDVMPPPPDDVVPVPPVFSPDQSVREQLAHTLEDAACAGCHEMMNPIGYGFEHYDAIGRWRDVDGGEPVDASGEIVGDDASSGPFEGARELSERLADSEEVARCVTTQWFRFARGRRETEADGCEIDRTHEAWLQAGGTMSELLVAITQSEGFRYRMAPEIPEEEP